MAEKQQLILIFCPAAKRFIFFSKVLLRRSLFPQLPHLYHWAIVPEIVTCPLYEDLVYPPFRSRATRRHEVAAVSAEFIFTSFEVSVSL